MSFWTAPLQEELNPIDYNLWLLSTTLLKRQFGNLTLFTDKRGKELLLDRFKINNFSDVIVCLDCLPFDGCWSFGKIFVYNMQKEPFMHFDHDVFVYNSFSEEFEKSNIIVQSTEDLTIPELKEYHKIDKSIACLENPYGVEFTNKDRSVNCGVFGGNNLDFIKNYSSKTFELFYSNKDSILKNFDYNSIAVFFEQFVLSNLLDQYKQPFECILKNEYELAEATSDIIPNSVGYSHFCGWLKKKESYVKAVQKTIELEEIQIHYL